MATLKRRFTNSPAAPDVRLTLDVVLGGPRPGKADPQADRAWLALRAACGHASYGGEFDPRHVLILPDTGLEDWRTRRLAWAVSLFADDQRVELP